MDEIFPQTLTADYHDESPWDRCYGHRIPMPERRLSCGWRRGGVTESSGRPLHKESPQLTWAGLHRPWRSCAERSTENVSGLMAWDVVVL